MSPPLLVLEQTFLMCKKINLLLQSEKNNKTIFKIITHIHTHTTFTSTATTGSDEPSDAANDTQRPSTSDNVCILVIASFAGTPSFTANTIWKRNLSLKVGKKHQIIPSLLSIQVKFETLQYSHKYPENLVENCKLYASFSIMIKRHTLKRYRIKTKTKTHTAANLHSTTLLL
mgnify:CR=1 FL=1